MLSSDAIKDGLRSVKDVPDKADPLLGPELRALLRACLRHDAARFTITRDENRAGGRPGSTPKHEPVAAFVLFVLLTGMRRDEARLLRWDRVRLKSGPSGSIRLEKEDTKTKHGRTVDLTAAPMLQELLAVLKLRAGDRPFVFEVPGVDEAGDPVLVPRSEEQVKAVRERLKGTYAAPNFTWQRLRDTAASHLVNACVFGPDTLRRASDQLGHSIGVAQARYWAPVLHLAPATTLEAAMGIEAEARAIVRQAGGERVAPEDMAATG